MNDQPSSSVHQTAQIGFSNPDNYEKARPSYQADCVDFIISLLGKSGSSGPFTVVDLAAGTGKLTRCLIPHFPSPSKLIAIDPVAGMREMFSKVLPGVEIRDGSGDSMPSIPDGSVDALLIGQAFHWFANESSLKEFHRILKPGALVAMIWNMEDRDNVEWVHNIRKEYEKYDLVCPQYRHNKWRIPWEGGWALEHFTPLESREWKWGMLVAKEAIWERVASKSYIASLDPEESNKLKERIEKIIQELPEKDIPYPHASEVAWAFKK